MRSRPLVARLSITAAAVTALAVVTPAQATPGQLDTSFGSSGTSWMPFRACDCASMMRVAPDNKIVVIGQHQITRLTANGQLDTTFGNGGQVPLQQVRSPRALLVDHAGRVVVAGYTESGLVDRVLESQNLGHAGVFQVWRWSTDGTPDAAFDALAESTLPTHPKTVAYNAVAVAEQTVGGVSRYLVGTDNNTALRLNESGQLDKTFGTNGFAGGDVKALYTTSFALNHRDGSFAFGGENRAGPAVSRFTSNGRVVSSFGRNGVAQAAVDGWTARVTFGPDGALFTAGAFYAAQSQPGGVTVVRLRGDGQPDPTFGNNGRTVATFPAVSGSTYRRDEATKVLVQSDGKIVVGGYAFYSVQNDRYQLQNFELARFLPTGALDTAFGSGGSVLGKYGETGDMTFQGSRILIGGDLETRCVADEGDGICVVANEPPPGTRLGMRIARYNG